jgi:hypothetical protein
MQNSRSVPGSSRRDVNATRAIASALGVFVGVSGLDHGFFETLQGNVPTPGLVVQAIGPAQRMWVRGTEEAFTLVPNFLATGILAMAVAVLIIVWSVRFIDGKHGSAVFLGLGALLFLVGGGVAQAAFVVLCFVVSLRIDRQASAPSAVHPGGVARTLAKAWPYLLAAGVVLYAVALEIAIAGVVPGVSNPDHLLAICWSSLGVMLVLIVLAIAGASAYDAGVRPDPPVAVDPR